ncbi:MAG: glucosidase, partial [Planctomycetes bacterium]|nr:glucosidase [Planctomycetota bacterium]
NTWTWGCGHEGCWTKPLIRPAQDQMLQAEHETLGRFHLAADAAANGARFDWLFTDNVTNTQRLYGVPNEWPYVKDAFHRYVVDGETSAVNPRHFGTMAAAHYVLKVAAGSQVEVRLRLFADSESPDEVFGPSFHRVLADRKQESEQFYAQVIPAVTGPEARSIARQAYAGLLWTKQFYHYVVDDWLTGDPNLPPPPDSRKAGRNADWHHLFNRDVLSVPDKWEYPWYAAWDLAFHMIPLARLDPVFAKDQLKLLLREWYMHPNGQVPAYEFDFGDVNPPVHAWACWRVYKMTGPRGQRDLRFLSSVFQKLLINFTWWVNRKDARGKHLFSGGFLGLDNIGVFDRSRPLPNGGHLEQADGTAWMAFYCATMLAMALELSQSDPAAEDIASKFFEHFVYIADAINTIGGTGLWNEDDGFYYDQLHVDGRRIPLRVRSMVGLIPLFTVQVLNDELIGGLRGFQKRLNWFLTYRRDLARHISYMETADDSATRGRHLLAIPSRERLERVLRYVLDEREFLSPYGVRSLSKYHRDNPYVFRCAGQEFRVEYVPGESNTDLFGGNSNWRGPIWFPVNYLLIEALERYHYFYGDSLKVECPTGSGRWMNLAEVAQELAYRLVKLFLPNAGNRRPYQGTSCGESNEPSCDKFLLFHEYFHGETGAGLGASHQTGWTSLVADCLWKAARRTTA